LEYGTEGLKATQTLTDVDVLEEFQIFKLGVSASYSMVITLFKRILHEKLIVT
jgi:hypothetical protein